MILFLYPKDVRIYVFSFCLLRIYKEKNIIHIWHEIKKYDEEKKSFICSSREKSLICRCLLSIAWHKVMKVGYPVKIKLNVFKILHAYCRSLVDIWKLKLVVFVQHKCCCERHESTCALFHCQLSNGYQMDHYMHSHA